ncbi:hypothetical protein ASPFODRAFT_43490 [Aspergillus luchuensis CBS 106.47]|uniref:Protein kinase domain-containing protein n=1 Tax=Aspergillus luchuensis (strain CBS 106.47) TaxID=1137211 RepID=A0A1M3TTS4_ASPLC|nr:hypothetical protein ASPFODRAFT_43490 [Aspergillus luchuensis CBS 106.47]
MKVYHAIDKQPWHPSYREIDPYICESAAYGRLKERGLCQQGIVPGFYGVIDQVNPMQWQPHLNKVLKDKHRPNAILLEFIPNLKQIVVETYTENRAAALLSIIQQIHEAGICHCDPYPRNMVVQPETDRVLWIDFDRAQIFNDQSITDRYHSWKEDDPLMTAELLDFLAKYEAREACSCLGLLLSLLMTLMNHLAETATKITLCEICTVPKSQ